MMFGLRKFDSPLQQEMNSHSIKEKLYFRMKLLEKLLDLQNSKFIGYGAGSWYASKIFYTSNSNDVIIMWSGVIALKKQNEQKLKMRCTKAEEELRGRNGYLRYPNAKCRNWVEIEQEQWKFIMIMLPTLFRVLYTTFSHWNPFWGCHPFLQGAWMLFLKRMYKKWALTPIWCRFVSSIYVFNLLWMDITVPVWLWTDA